MHEEEVSVLRAPSRNPARLNAHPQVLDRLTAAQSEKKSPETPEAGPLCAFDLFAGPSPAQATPAWAAPSGSLQTWTPSTWHAHCRCGTVVVGFGREGVFVGFSSVHPHFDGLVGARTPDREQHHQKARLPCAPDKRPWLLARSFNNKTLVNIRKQRWPRKSQPT